MRHDWNFAKYFVRMHDIIRDLQLSFQDWSGGAGSAKSNCRAHG